MSKFRILVVHYFKVIFVCNKCNTTSAIDRYEHQKSPNLKIVYEKVFNEMSCEI